ncbi:MAG: right-handed parallel beta-helix repeat-containing protein [Fuerstiella sp.]|jgi:parallel beta-helix repeat protein|nr:right-handed parallel beta-helix repeat-containing protein [Fuerstiella sp.]
MNQVLTLAGLLLCTATPVAGKTIRVPVDAQTIQAAIDSASDDDVVLVSAGTYRERIVLKPRVTVKSDGDDAAGKLGLARAEATIIDGTIADTKANDVRSNRPGVTMAAAAVLDGFTVVGVGHYDEALWKKHHTTQGNQQHHEHIGAPGTPGIAIEGVDCIVRNNIVHHIGYTGIAIRATGNRQCSPLVFRNTCYRNMGGGIGSMAKSTGTIRGNMCFENFYAGIGNNDASPLIVDNTCYRNIRAGIGISDGSAPIVRDNRCHENRRAGIGVRTGSTTRPVIENNECYKNMMAGIGAEEHAAPVISKNRCYENKLAGIGCRDHARPTISENECYKNGTVGIGHEGDSVTTLIRNHCHDNQAAGMGFSQCESGQATLIGNRVTNNAKVAVGIHSGWSVIAIGNELTRDGGMPPVVMIFSGAKASFVGNTIRGEGVAGIRVAGELSAVKNTLTCPKPRKQGPPSIGVWALDGSKVTLSENTFEGWRSNHTKSGSKPR